MELRQEDIAEILRIFNESELQELRLDIGGSRLYLSKQAGAAPRWEEPTGSAVPAQRAAPPQGAEHAPDDSGPAAATQSAVGATPAPVAAPVADNLVELKSPLLGVFYRRPSPDKAPFVEIGSEVDADAPVCIIDVMKMFSRVPAGTAGRIVEILAQDGQLVEHGQVLMRLEPR